MWVIQSPISGVDHVVVEEFGMAKDRIFEVFDDNLLGRLTTHPGRLMGLALGLCEYTKATLCYSACMVGVTNNRMNNLTAVPS